MYNFYCLGWKYPTYNGLTLGPVILHYEYTDGDQDLTREFLGCRDRDHGSCLLSSFEYPKNHAAWKDIPPGSMFIQQFTFLEDPIEYFFTSATDPNSQDGIRHRLPEHEVKLVPAAKHHLGKILVGSYPLFV